MKNILIINGNPKENSLSKYLATELKKSFSPFHSCRLTNIRELEFNPDLSDGYDEPKCLEDDLIEFRQHIIWAEHLVILTPVWWGGMPAKLKGLFDRVFLPGFAFTFSNDSIEQTKLLVNKTASLVLTMDSPLALYESLNSPLSTQLKSCILEFSGIQVTSENVISPTFGLSPKLLEITLETVTKDIERVIKEPL